MSITLMNAGRGAGKTYTLVQWALQNPKRIVVGSEEGTKPAMAEAGLSNQYVSYVEARSKLVMITSETEVAFDDFGPYLTGVLLREFHLRRENSVILATNLPKSDLLEQKEVPFAGIAGIASTVPGTLRDLFKGAEDSLDKVFTILADAINETETKPEEPAKEPEPDPVPDVMSVRLDELTIGDVFASAWREKVVGLSRITKGGWVHVVVETEAGDSWSDYTYTTKLTAKASKTIMIEAR